MSRSAHKHVILKRKVIWKKIIQCILYLYVLTFWDFSSVGTILIHPLNKCSLRISYTQDSSVTGTRGIEMNKPNWILAFLWSLRWRMPTVNTKTNQRSGHDSVIK